MKRRCIFKWYGVQIVIGVAYCLNMERGYACGGSGVNGVNGEDGEDGVSGDGRDGGNGLSGLNGVSWGNGGKWAEWGEWGEWGGWEGMGEEILGLDISSAEEATDEVGAVDLTEEAENGLAFGWLVPEEELTLGELFFLCLGGEDGLEGVGMESCVPCLGGDGHGGGGEVLHLFELEVEVFGQCGKFGHIFGCAAGVGADEVGDDLLAEVMAEVDVVEDALEVVEETEGGFAHEGEHTVGSVFGCHFETTADVMGDEFFGVLAIDAVGAFIACVVEQEVVADT